MKIMPKDVGLGGSVVDIGELNRQMKEQLGPMTAGRFAFQMCEGTESVEFGVK